LFIVKEKESNKVVAICSDKKDAEAIRNSSKNVDEIEIVIEEVRSSDAG
jgi:hypothetical protein